MSVEIRIKGKVELQKLSDKIRRWSKQFPRLTKDGLRLGTKIIENEVKRTMRKKLTIRTGNTVKNIVSKVWIDVDKVKAVVGYKAIGKHNVYAMIAQAHEFGAPGRMTAGGQPYRVINGRAIFLPRGSEGPGIKLTKSAANPLRKRPSFRPALRKKQKHAVDRIMWRIMKGFEDER